MCFPEYPIMPNTNQHRKVQQEGLLVDTSGAPPGMMRREAFHFLAAPAPQWASNWVGENSRCDSGFWRQCSHSHCTRRLTGMNRPCVVPHSTRT